MNTRDKIRKVCDELKDMLVEKNRKYGDSAINPIRVFSKADPSEQIKIRLDDKLSRIVSGQSDDDEDVINDLIGYLVLLKVIKINEAEEMEDKISIILTSRNTLDFLKLAVKSIRKNFKTDYELIIYDDASTDGSLNWIKNNRLKYNYKYIAYIPNEDSIPRKGITGAVDEAVNSASGNVVFIVHSDMYFGKNTDKIMLEELNKVGEKGVLTCTRIEPPLYPEAPHKIIKDFGVEPKEFKERDFNSYVSLHQSKERESTKGIFAPIMCYKKFWDEVGGHSEVYYPQSREDSDLFRRMLEKGAVFSQNWNAVCYHFSGRGSRKKDGINKDSEEWKQSNEKNERNYIRDTGARVLHDKYLYPILPPKIPVSAVILTYDLDKKHMYDFMKNVEPYFEDIIVVIDSDIKDSWDSDLVNEITRYMDDEENLVTNFNRHKIKIHAKKLERFDDQRNFGTGLCENDWVLHMDPDEVWDRTLLDQMRMIIKNFEEQGKTCCGFARANFLEGVLVNDIPRSEWTKEGLMKYKGKPNNAFNNADYQFRLHNKSTKWTSSVGGVHESLDVVIDRQLDKVGVIENSPVIHNKSLDMQSIQDNKYSKFEKTKNVVFNSVLFTKEGITAHAREEIKGLLDYGYTVFCEDTNYKEGYGLDAKDIYNNFDRSRNDYISIVNQPPIRQNNPLFSLVGNAWRPNLIYYIAVEGIMPNYYADVINKSQTKVVLTPSKYCREKLLQTGVRKPIKILHHGVDESIYKPNNDLKANERFRFTYVGTAHMIPDRKGLDIVLEAFSEEFSKEMGVELVCKINPIYAGQNPFKRFKRFIKNECNIRVTTDDLSEEEMATFLQSSDTYLQVARSEGFGMVGLEAMACGVPVISTCNSGENEYVNSDNAILLKEGKESFHPPLVQPYEKAKWFTIDKDNLKKKMRYAFENHKELKAKAMDNSKKIREEFSWKKISEELNKIIEEM